MPVVKKNRYRQLLQRFFCPAFLVSLYYLVKYRAMVSTKAEVELSSSIRLGRKTTVGSFTKLKATEGQLTIGVRSGIANGCFISASTGGLQIGDNFICGPNVVIVSSNYVTEKKGIPLADQGHFSKGVKIGDNVWVGANSTVLDGTEIGDDCIVVANSLVNRRFPAGSVIQGNPAKVIFRR